MRPSPDEFMDTVRGPLEAGDAHGLARGVSAHWTPGEVGQLLSDADPSVRGAAAISLGLMGHQGQSGLLSGSLRDEDGWVRQMAEHALWSLWLRGGHVEAVETFQRGLRALSQGAYGEASDLFDDTLERDPEFAEAYHQAGLAQAAGGSWERASDSFRAAAVRQPTHFAAWAGLGHCCCQLEQWPEALDAYRRAEAIHPRMSDLAESIDRVTAKLSEVQETEAFALPRR
jgi:tetratricopeptide (TPR) repeat protein